MAISASTVVEVRTGGADTNGGGFVTGASGTDWTLQNAAQYSVTDAVTAGTTTITSATASFGTDVVGNLAYVQGGTGSITAAWYQIISRTNSTTIVVDRSTGLSVGTGATLKIGGAMASPGGVGGITLVNNNKVWIKAGTYSVTSASTNVAAGCFSASVQLFIEGYNSTRGDLGTKPLIQASSINTFTLIAATGSRSIVSNLRLDGASQTSSRGLNVRGSAYRCKFENCTNSGYTITTTGIAMDCEATGCSTQAAFLGGMSYVDCVARDNTVGGFSTSANGATFVRCIADSNSGASSDGFGSSSENATFINCVSYNNGRDGYRLTDRAVLENSIAETNAGVGFNLNSTNCVQSRLRNCAYYNNSGGNTTFGSIANIVEDGSITGTGSFFTDAANANFALNNTASAGAALRAAGYPGALPFGGTGYLDIGALQHQDTGGGGTSYTGFFIQ